VRGLSETGVHAIHVRDVIEKGQQRCISRVVLGKDLQEVLRVRNEVVSLPGHMGKQTSLRVISFKGIEKKSSQGSLECGEGGGGQIREKYR